MPTYDDLAADMAGAAEPQKPAGAATLYTAADVNPDAEAGLLKLSKRTGIPAEALRLDTARKDAERQSKANQYDTLLKSSPATAKWLDDLGNARLAHDDTESLSKMEFGLGKLKSAGRAVGAGLTGFNEGFYGVLQAPAEMAQAAAEPLAGTLLPENPLTRMVDAIKARRQKEAEATKSLMYNPSAGPTERGVYSGIQSLTQNLMTLPLAVMSGRPELTLYPMAAQTGGQAYGQARDKGLSIPSALTFGTSQAAVEYATEKIPVGRFLNDLAKNTGFTKMIAGQLASEIPGEQVATLLQDLNEWAVLNPEKPFKSYLDERPGAAYQTLVATIVGTGGNVAIGKAGQAVANRMGAAGKAQEDGKTISDLVAEAGKNKVRARSPETFSQFVQQTAEQTGNAPTEVYIDAKQFQAALNQEGVDQGAIIAAMPSVAQQFDEAVSTGGDLVVPIGELLTATPGTPLEQSLIPHVRTSADAMSMAEAQDAQTNQADYFAQEADRILKEQADSTALQGKSQAVYDDILTQLNTAGRNTADVNKAYADFMRNFFVTLSGRTGQDINELYKQYGPTIAAQLPAVSSDALNATQKPLEQGAGTFDFSVPSDGNSLRDIKIGGTTVSLNVMGRHFNPEGIVDIASIRTPAAKRGKGGARAAMQALISQADSQGVTLRLDASPLDNKTQLNKLVDFYRSFGFEPTGRSNNALGHPEMLRQPQAAQQLNQSAYTADTIEVDGVTRPATNSKGQPIAQTEEGLRNFWRWFGDSKVVDAEGKPLVVYHGTASSFEAFDPARVASATDGGIFGNGFYFAKDANLAEAYALQSSQLNGGDSNVMPVYLRIENPFLAGGGSASQGHINDIAGSRPTNMFTDEGKQWGEKLRDGLLAAGYDGVMDSGKRAAYANEFVAFSPEQIKSAVGNQGTFDPASPNILEQNTGAPRGAFNPDALTITLLKAADLTTFLHESAHYFLTVYEQIATQPNAPEGVAKDVDALLQWMGVEPTPEQTRAEVWAGMSLDQKRKGHEQFAESFEQWLFGGKAPSMEMQSLFERFRTWMMRTYKSLQQFVATHKNAKLNPEIEQVFSRMLASEEQTKAAEQFRNMYPLFDSAEAAGMTPEQFAAYQAEGRDASAESAKDMARRGLRDMQWLGNAKAKALKALQKEADALRDEVRKEVSDEVNAEPVYRVWQFLTGKKSEDNTTGKLLRADMVERYGADSEIVKTLEARKMLTNSGTQSDVLAETFGYSSGDEMVQALAAAEPPKAAIDAITDQRMLERHGEMATPDALERAAEAAIHNDARAKFLATEYAAVNKQLGSVRLIAKAAKEYAANIVARTRIMDIKPARYAAAEARAARMAAEAMRKGERDKVVTEKRNQLLNNATAKAMHEARDEAKSIAEYLKKFDKEGTRKNLDTEYLDQIDTLLERYDLRVGTSAKDIARRESLRTWVVRQLKNGDIPDIAETLLSPQERAKYKAEVESRDADGDLVYADDEERIKLLADAIDRSETRSYKELTMDELRGLYDTVRQIEHLGRMKHTLLTAVDQASYEAARDDIASTITDNAKQSGKNTRTPNDWLGQKLAGLKQFGASHIKIATWARIMDGGKENGAVWRYLIRPANERASRETTMRAEATKALDEILRPLLAKVSMADKVGKGKFFPSIGESLNWQERFAVALNTGNEGNLQRLLDGRGWTMQQIMPVLNSLSAEEWHAVQKVWDHSESYRPQIAAKERRVTGKEPNWVEPREISVKTADGKEVTLRGGYYPVVYDPRVNLKAQQHTAAEEAKGLMKAAYSAATTRRSFTKERAEEVKGRPLLLNMQGLYSGVNDVIHDLTWHEWVIDMNKLLRSKTIDQAIREHYGPEVKREFEKWRDDVVAGTRRLDHGIEKAAAWARQGVSASGLTFNLMSAAMQPLGLTQSIVRVGAKWVGKGIARYAAHPIETTKEANEKSEWMRNRSRTRFRELNELRNQVQGQTVAREMLSTYGYFFMMRMQQAVDVPTWWGAYEKAIAQGEKEDTAVALADQAVKDAQGGGEEVDQAGIERGGPLIKLFTVFYSFMNTAANLGYGQARTESSKAKLAVDMLLLYTVPAILGYALRNALTPGDSGDDDEELVKKLISEQLSYLMGLVAFGREFAQVGKVITGEDKGQGYSGPAGLRVIPDSVALAKQAKQGEFDDAFRKSFINLAGDLFGLPAAQANRTITGAQAIAEGKTANPAAIAFGYQEKK